MATFPGDVGIRYDGATYEANSVVLRTRVERGLARTRRHSKRASVHFSGTLLFLTPEIRDSFDVWYKDDVNGAARGAAWFAWKHPATEQIIQARFISLGARTALHRCFHIAQQAFTLEYIDA